MCIVALLYSDTFKSVIFEYVKVKSVKIKNLFKNVGMIQKIISHEDLKITLLGKKQSPKITLQAVCFITGKSTLLIANILIEFYL